MFVAVICDPRAGQKLLEAIRESASGRRSLSRLARTCRAASKPALDVLWRDLDSFVPVLGLFPSAILKKARRPGLGLSQKPQDSDWDTILKYSSRIRKVVYDETANNVAASIFPVLEEALTRLHLFPNLQELVWKAETPTGLGRCQMFISAHLRDIAIEVGANFKKEALIADFLRDMSTKTKLTSFSFSSPTSLPSSFTDLLARQDSLQRVVLCAPGALSSGVGQWLSSLPALRSLQLDLTGRSPIAVEGFFDEIYRRSGSSTPNSIMSSDSDISSIDKNDFSALRKSTLRLTEEDDKESKSSFSSLRRVQLTGEVGNIAVFLKHIPSPLTHIDLVIEDPPDNADWQDLSSIISESFGDTLQCLRITPTNASRYADITVRAAPRSETPARRLSLENFSGLNRLTRLEIDLVESIVFLPSDLEAIADACPKLEVLRLCALARFTPSSGGPKISLEDLAMLTRQCKYLHTIGAVVNAIEASEDTLVTQSFSSRSLLRLYLGGSWITGPLPVAILLSHMAPRLETLRFFQEKNRVGFNETNARNWQSVTEILPHLQAMRRAEKSFSARPIAETAEKGVGAIVQNSPKMVNVRVQCSPSVVDREVHAVPVSSDVEVDATPELASVGIDATSPPEQWESESSEESEADTMETMMVDDEEMQLQQQQQGASATNIMQQLYLLPSLISVLAILYRCLVIYPMVIPAMGMRALRVTASHVKRSGVALMLPASGAEENKANDVALPEIAPMHYVYPFMSEWDEEEEDNPSPASQEEAESIVGTWLRDSAQTRGNKSATRHLELELAAQTRSPYNNLIMSDVKKQEKDYTPEVEALLPQADALAKSGKLQEALDKIFSLEKLTRNASDLASTSKLTKAAVTHCYEARDYPLLNSTISLLSKKHGQLKAAISAFVEQVIEWLPEIRKKDGEERWLELLETLRTVTEGKIFLETPRARVTLLLAQHHEALSESPTTKDRKAALQTASDLLSDLQVETYSSMERREKTEFILEQMRLLIKVARQKDAELGQEKSKDLMGGGEAEWVKVRVGGRKVNEEFLKDKANEDLKLKYYDMMIQHALHQDEYLDVAKYYYKVWETPTIKEDTNGKGKAALEHIAYYIVLAPHTNEQSDMLHHLFVDPALPKLELQYNLVKCFTTKELMRWPGIESIYGKFLQKTPVFSQAKRWEDLHSRVVEHNIRVVAEYYTRITIPRLSGLLDLNQKETEAVLSRLVVGGTVWAKVDRPAGIISFRPKRSAEDVMNDWSSDMQKLLSLVEKTWMGMNAAQAAQARATS